MTKLKFLLILIMIVPLKSFAAFEFDFDFGYDRQIYGSQRQNSVISRNYSVGLSSYIFNLTAIDINVANNQDITTQNDRYTVGTNLDVISQQSRMRTNVYGIGVKQMLAGRGSMFIPVISVGYARQFTTSNGEITTENTATKAQTVYTLAESKQRENSVFGSFTLQVKLTERFSLKGTVRTLFPAFEFGKARDNIKYLVGFSWIF